MANNIITEENLSLIRELIPNIVYDELMGNLDIEDKPIEVSSIEPVKETTIEDLEASLDAAKIGLEFADEKDRGNIQDYIDALEVQIEILKQQ